MTQFLFLLLSFMTLTLAIPRKTFRSTQKTPENTQSITMTHEYDHNLMVQSSLKIIQLTVTNNNSDSIEAVFADLPGLLQELNMDMTGYI